MDITQELLEITSSENFGTNVYEDLKKQQEDLIKKIHLVNIIGAATEIESLVASNFFDKDKVKFLDIITGKGFPNDKDVYFDCLDKNRQFAEHSDGHYYQKLMSKIFRLEELNMNLTNIDFSSDGDHHTFELDKGIGEKILKLFLTDELRAIYEYNKMKIELPENNKNGKKLKI